MPENGDEGVAQGADTGHMNTQNAIQRPLLRRHTEIIGGLLLAVLFAAVYCFSNPPVQTALFGIGPDADGIADVGPAMIPAVLAMMVTVAVAMTSASAIARVVSWLALIPAGIVAFIVWWVGYGIDSGLAWTDPVTEVLFMVAIAVPPVAFLLVCWRSERPSVATYVGEAVLLFIIGFLLWLYAGNFREFNLEDGTSVPTMLIFLGAAVFFAVAAWLVPTRRIFYGAVALDGAVMVGLALLGFSTVTDPTDPMNLIMNPAFAAVAIIIPIVGALLQIAWWAKGRIRGESNGARGGAAAEPAAGAA